MSKTSKEVDSEGYKLLELTFESKGYSFERVEDFKDGWLIYKKSKGGNIKYELVKPHKNEEYIIHGSIVPKKWSYPGDNAFGRTGFDCVSLDRAHVKHKEIVDKEKSEESATQNKLTRKLKVPNSKNFTVKEVKKLNADWSTHEIRLKLNDLISQSKIIWTNEKNYKPPQEKTYSINK